MLQGTKHLLQVEGLTVDFDVGKPTAHRTLEGVSLSIGPGEVVGLVGESVSGKTALSPNIHGLLPRNGRVTGGTVRWKGRDLQKLSEKELRPIQGEKIAIVFQDPQARLKPVYPGGRQLESLLNHQTFHPNVLSNENGELQEHRADSLRYPHKVSVAKVFPAARTDLWEIAGHPAKVSKGVPMLRWFYAPRHLLTGCKVAEQHIILGWPQTYQGRITDFRFGSLWSMSSHPTSWGPFSLPHSVDYAFSGNERESLLTITCSFSCGGLLALPFIASLVKRIMRRSCEALLRHVSAQADAFCNNHSITHSAGAFVPNPSR